MEALQWLAGGLKKRFEVKTGHVGGYDGCNVGGQTMNRIVRCTEQGVELESDPRHAELIAEQLGLTLGTGVGTPGTDALDDVEPETIEDDFSDEQKSMYRCTSARCNY